MSTTKMQQLPSSTVRLLSSSQVVTSVVSVVKELLENALDANATCIDVKLENYGFDKIEIRDNGDGIKATDTPVMAVQHYTSKISSHEDLESLETYGFRGEALGSICSLAEVFITTKTAADEVSTQYTMDNSGHIISQKPSHLGQGTTVTVLKLFKNLPVRKQFYSTSKKCKDELKKIQDLLMAYGIIKPELRVTFTHNKAVIWQKTRVSDHKTAFMSVLGTAIMSSMVPFEHDSENSQVLFSGFLPSPDSDCSLTSFSSPEKSFIFINRRPVCEKDILKLVRQYYNVNFNKDSSRSYPVFFINITLPASALDVNLTPDKTQVMMQNKESVLLAMENVLMSLYGPLPGTVSCEKDKADVTSVNMFVKTPESTDVLVNEIAPSGNHRPKTHTSSFSFSNDVQNGQTGKNTGVCFKHQIIVYDHPPALANKRKDSDSDAVRDDLVQSRSVNNISAPKNDQTGHGVMLAIDDIGLIPSQSENDKVSLQGDGQISMLERIKEAPVVSEDTPEICTESWSKGNALKNSSGDYLQPVKIMIPVAENILNLQAGDRTEEAQSSKEKIPKSLSQKVSNVINQKSGQITPYDLISNRVIRKPMSASDFFQQEYCYRALAENPQACMEDVVLTCKGLWKTLSEEDREKHEEKAARDLERYTLQTTKAAEQNELRRTKQTEKRHRLSSAPKSRLNGPLSNQQILDTLFQSQNEKKLKDCPLKIVPITFTLSSLKQRLEKLSEKRESDRVDLGLINKLSSPGAWIIASEKKIMLLNPYRVEEALLFKRLMENHKIPAEPLDNPITLTDSVLSGSNLMETLCSLEQDTPRLNGWTYVSDQRLITNGFKIKILAGSSILETRVEVESMADILPYYGLSDLKEILNAVKYKNAKKVCECRPLKVRNYLEGEAVRLSRQLPLYLSTEDVQDTICRMKQQLANENKGCVHGRPFFHHLIDIPADK